MDGPSEITALTLNCWGLKFISTLRRERLAEIGRRLAVLAAPSPTTAGASLPSPFSAPLSIVALQECWCYEDFATIHELTSHALPYAKFFHSGVWGAGLAVLSRWPITQTSMFSYPLNGRPTAFWRGDWFVGKGLASATVRVSDQTTLEVLVTHTHAPYEAGQPDDSYLVHQLSQTWEAGKRMRAAAERGRLVLAMGDFNMTPDSLPYTVLFLGAAAAGESSSHNTASFAMCDTWRELHPDASLGPVNHPAEQARQRQLQQRQPQTASAIATASPFVPSAIFNLEENGAASDNILNTWRWPKDKQKRLHKSYRQRWRRQRQHAEGEDEIDSEFVIAPDAPDPRGKRLDYIFYALPSTPSGAIWRTKTARVGMVEPHPALGCSVSDHFAVEVTLACLQNGQQAPNAPSDHASKTNANVSLAVYDEVLAESEKYMIRERKQRRWRSVHFFLSVAVTIGSFVAVWFSPRPFVAFLLMLLASLGLAAGVVDGLIALLFFGSEIRSLKEFNWEIRNARANALSVQSSSSHAGKDKSGAVLL